MYVVSARAPFLDFSVSMCAVGVYTIDQRGYRIHRSEVVGDFVDNRVLRWEHRIVKSGFGGGSVGTEAARQGRCVRKSCPERTM